MHYLINGVLEVLSVFRNRIVLDMNLIRTCCVQYPNAVEADALSTEPLRLKFPDFVNSMIS